MKVYLHQGYISRFKNYTVQMLAMFFDTFFESLTEIFIHVRKRFLWNETDFVPNIIP